MAEQRRPLQPGDAVPDFTLPAANRDGNVSMSDLRGRPFLIGFYPRPALPVLPPPGGAARQRRSRR